MITTNVYQRVFQVRTKTGSTGTAFTIDRDGKQYLVTARHIADDFDSNKVEIFHDSRWKSLSVTLVGNAPIPIDITVLTASITLSPHLDLPATQDGLSYGQDVYFLGFPFGLRCEIESLSYQFPIPFCKKATLSAVASATDGSELLYLDGHNNPGFSGGPVVFSAPLSRDLPQYKVGGVISGYRYSTEPVYLKGSKTELQHNSNTGIIISYSIRHATDVIDSNPIGVPCCN